MQRENFRKAIAIVTAMDATREDTTMSTEVVMGYIRENTVVLEGGQVELGAVDLVSGLSMLATALLALREDETGVSREETLRDLALRIGG
jgi:hypothetical protein